MKTPFLLLCLFISSIVFSQAITDTGTKVGIGTATPAHKLVVQGDSSPNVELKNSNYSNGGFILNRTNYGQQWKWWSENNQMYFGYSTDESTYSNKLAIKSNGNIGIGTISPSNVQGWQNVLDVYGENHSKIIATTNTSSLITGIYSHGSNWNGFVGRIGTESNHDLRLMAGYGLDQVTIKTSGNVGIGTSNPTSNLHIVNGGISGGLDYNLRIQKSVVSDQDGSTVGMVFSTESNSLGWGKGAIVFERTDSYGVGTMHFLNSPYNKAADPTLADSKMSIFSNGNVGIGTTSSDAKLTVKGNIHTNEVKVDLLGAVAPDYVFYNDYDLKSLKAVEDYIANNGHLPNIPCAKEMESEGIMLKEMNLKLLEKIEELTLYAIEQEKKLEKVKLLEEELQNQEIINENLEERLQKIESLLNSKK